MIFAVKSFVTRHMGTEFTIVPSFDMSCCFRESDKLKPIILVLYPGCDPLSPVFTFTPEKRDERPKGINVLSLGQGQGPAAEEAIMEAASSGKIFPYYFEIFLLIKIY